MTSKVSVLTCTVFPCWNEKPIAKPYSKLPPVGSRSSLSGQTGDWNCQVLLLCYFQRWKSCLLFWSAPHSIATKESSCGCAGIFSGHAAIELYAEAFDSVGALDKLEGFTSVFGQRFYGLEPHQHRITLRRENWSPPATFQFGDAQVRPLRAGEIIEWKIVNLES